MATVTSGQTTVTTTAGALHDSSLAANWLRLWYAWSSKDVFVGPSGTTTSDGCLIPKGEWIDFGATDPNVLYVITETGTAIVYWISDTS